MQYRLSTDCFYISYCVLHYLCSPYLSLLMWFVHKLINCFLWVLKITKLLHPFLGCKPRDLWNLGCYCEKQNRKSTGWFPYESACGSWFGLSKPENVSSFATKPWTWGLSGCCGEGNIFYHRWPLVWHLCRNKPR